MKIIKSISQNKKVSRFGKQIQLATKCSQLRVPLSCTVMAGLRRCCSDSVPYLARYLACYPAHKPNGSRSILAPTPRTHPAGVPPTRIFYVRVAHTPIFILCIRQISNPIPDQPLTQLYTPSGMNRRLTYRTIPARL